MLLLSGGKTAAMAAWNTTWYCSWNPGWKTLSWQSRLRGWIKSSLPTNDNCDLLGTGSDLSFEDNCDWIKFNAEFSGELSFSDLGEGDMITVNGRSYGINDAIEIAAGNDYIVSITRAENADSTHYSMILA